MTDTRPDEKKLYGERDIFLQAEYYCNHISAMTAEGLHGKSEIAAELAHRDMRIAELEEALKPFAEAGVKGTSRKKAFNQAGFSLMEQRDVFIHTAKTFLCMDDFTRAATLLDYNLE